MEKIYRKNIYVGAVDVNSTGKLKLSALLRYVQEVSGNHSDLLGADWDSLAEKNLFWVVLRHRVIINRLPEAGENLQMETWPLPTTRSAYPRVVRAMDDQGNTVFETASLWVLMNIKTRQMVLPGKSGVEVLGMLRGDEPELPGSLVPGNHQQFVLWQVSAEDLDINGHVNNAKYLDHVETLLQGKEPKEVTVCYLSEVLQGQEISMGWTRINDESISVDGFRRWTDVPDRKERVFAANVQL